jgi:hypothetical protein
MTKPTQTNRHRKMVSHTIDPKTIEAMRLKTEELGINQSRFVELAIRNQLKRKTLRIVKDTPEQTIAPKIRCA